MSYGFRGTQRTLLVFALGSLLCSVSLAQRIRTSYQPGLDFSKFHTYRWVEIKGLHPDPDVDAQIKQLIDSQMAKRSLTKTDGEAADLYVDYQTAISKATKWETYEDWTSAGLMDGRLPQRREVTIDVGTLVIDLYDAPEKRLVWSGHATKTLDPKSSREQRAKNVEKATQLLFKNYPPK